MSVYNNTVKIDSWMLSEFKKLGQTIYIKTRIFYKNRNITLGNCCLYLLNITEEKYNLLIDYFVIVSKNFDIPIWHVQVVTASGHVILAWVGLYGTIEVFSSNLVFSMTMYITQHWCRNVWIRILNNLYKIFLAICIKTKTSHQI